MGKTTCAAARALIEAAAGARVLVASTDPAHSLGDALAVRLSFAPRGLRAVASRASARLTHRSATARGWLHAVEVDARRAFGRWLAQHRAALGDALEHGTWLDRADIDALLDLPLPGIDELAAMLEIARLAGLEPGLSSDDLPPSSRRRPPISAPPYDIVVVDTAPTGHTLRLLAAPEAVSAVARVLDDLQEEHRIIRERFIRGGRPDAADRVIALLAAQAQQMASVLHDAHRTTFHWVTLPEALSLAETQDGIAALETSGLRIAEVVVNRMLPRGGPCAVCDARRTAEQRVVSALARQLGRRHRLCLVRAELREPRGVAALASIGRAMSRNEWGSGRSSAAGRRSPEASRRAFSLSKAERRVAVEKLAAFRDASLLFIGGKGGVGKTTVAAAAALRLARMHPERQMLLLSTDPAHSLGDVLNLPPGALGDEPRTIPHGPPNLAVRELDAVRALAARRTVLERALDDIAESFGVAAPRQRGADFMGLAPPGIDELFGILSVVEARERYQLIVVDMAPTGHALRLLEQPDAAREWVQALLRVLLKYRSVTRPGQLARELVALSKSIRGLQALLCDASRTHVVVVTRAAELPRRETERLLTELRRLKMAIPAIVVNAMTLGPGRCSRCRATAALERPQLAVLQRRGDVRSRRCVIIQTPLSAPPPRGIVALEAWASQWTCGEPGGACPSN